MSCYTNNETGVETTPDSMDCLEWEDEIAAKSQIYSNVSDESIKESTSLYYYNAKTFEHTGDIVSTLENYNCDHNNSNKIQRQDPHTIDHMTMAPLHSAAFREDDECARNLLEHDAKVNEATSVGYTPCDITLLLLEYVANPNANTGQQLFYKALKYQNTKVAQVLLQTNRVNVNEVYDNDKTPLMYAIANDQNEVAMDLICRGAKVNLQDKDGKTALYYAIEKNNIILASRLLERGARHITSHYALHQCVAHKMTDMLKLLLRYDDHRHSLKVRNSEGFTPIQIAIIHKQTDMLEYMLNTDAASLKLDMEKILLFAVQYFDNLAESKTILRLLFAYGNEFLWCKQTNLMTTSSLGCYTPYCNTPLSRAIMLGKLDIAEFLIKEGVDIQQQICRHHVINHLRTLKATGYKQFAKLLILNGFKFPLIKRNTNIVKKFSKERQDFEDYINYLTQQPLEQKCLARIKIRQNLIDEFRNATIELKQKYRATNDKSTIQQMIEHLDIPKILQKYLIDFDDCESVMPFYAKKENSKKEKNIIKKKPNKKNFKNETN